MNKWFGDVFLQSIFDNVGAGKQKWLSAKQTAICVSNMRRTVVRYDSDGYGKMYNHENYDCTWNGRYVHMWYSKKNGCGCIEFGYNEEESATLRAEAMAEKERLKAERIERILRNPELRAKKIAKLKQKLESWEEEYETDIEYGDEEQAKQDLEFINEIKEELKKYIN
jgi:hypothetical protein